MCLYFAKLSHQTILLDIHTHKYKEDIYIFEVNTKCISSSAVKKNQYFSWVHSTSENADIYIPQDEL